MPSRHRSSVAAPSDAALASGHGSSREPVLNSVSLGWFCQRWSRALDRVSITVSSHPPGQAAGPEGGDGAWVWPGAGVRACRSPGRALRAGVPLVLWASLSPVWQGRRWAGGFTCRDVARNSCLCSSRSDTGGAWLSALVGVSPRAMRGSGSCRGCTDGPQGVGTGAQGARSPVWGQEPMGTGAQCGDRCLASPLHEDRRWSRSCDPWGAGPFAGLGGAWAGSPLGGGAGSGRVSVCRPVWAWPQCAVSSGVPSSAGTDLSR